MGQVLEEVNNAEITILRAVDADGPGPNSEIQYFITSMLWRGLGIIIIIIDIASTGNETGFIIENTNNTGVLRNTVPLVSLWSCHEDEEWKISLY